MSKRPPLNRSLYKPGGRRLTEFFISHGGGEFNIMEDDRMDDIDQSKVYFVCRTCNYVFEADPNFCPIVCPQCGSEDTMRT